jgi:hypothetical protein
VHLFRVAVVVWLAFCCACAMAAPATPPSLVLVAASSGRVVATFRLGADPLRVSYGSGSFWAVLPDSRTIVRIDPRRRSVERRAVGVEPYDTAASGRALWVADHDGRDVLRIDWQTGSVRRSDDLGGPQLAVAYAFGSAWAVGADHALRRLDPASLRVTASLPEVAHSVERYEPKIAVGSGSLWVSDAVLNSVARVDPVRLRVIARYRRGGAGVAAGKGGVWSTDSFLRVLRVAGGPPAVVKTGAGAIDVAIGGDTVWVVNRFAGTLVRVDARRPRVTQTIRIGGSPIGVAYGNGYVAVAVR